MTTGAAAARDRRVQRGGPSTGLPTKTEQADLLQAMFGRNGEAPLPIVAPRRPATASPPRWRPRQIAVNYRDPGDPAVRRLAGQRLRAVEGAGRHRAAAHRPRVRHRAEHAGRRRVLALPARRRHARPALGGTRHPGLEHRIGGLEKADGRGIISYDPDNHDRMVRLRAAKIDGIAASGRCEVDDPTGDADLLVLGWGSTYGPIGAGAAGCARWATRSRRRTCATSTRCRPTSATCCAATGTVLVPEMNLGQLALLLRGEYLVDVMSYTKVAGLPFGPRSCRTSSWTT